MGISYFVFHLSYLVSVVDFLNHLHDDRRREETLTSNLDGDRNWSPSLILEIYYGRFRKQYYVSVSAKQDVGIAVS